MPNSTKEMLKDHLIAKGAFSDNIHELVTKTTNCIDGEVPERLKLIISLSEIITLTSHLRKPIQLHDGTIVPCNAISFALASSGVSKDSSMNKVRKALSPSYDLIDTYRKDLAKHNAERAAILAGKPKEDWPSFYTKPRDLQAGLGTVEGLVGHFSDLAQGDIGAASINSSEIGSELLMNGHITDIIKTISIGYDLGKVPAKIIKSAENQTDSIDGLPINALFFGSQDAILYDNSIKAKFKTMFGVQLARRSIFSFTPEEVLPIKITNVSDIFKYREMERTRTLAAQQEVMVIMEGIVENTSQDPLVLSAEAQELFDIYKEYNNLQATDENARYPITKLSRRHKQWLALKLSGNYAVLDSNTEVTEKNYINAINTVEMFSNDLQEFEKELVKEPYEIFAEFCKHEADNGKFTIGLHELRKLGYIPMTGSADSKIKELVHLVSSYDQEAIYTVCKENGICYDEIVKTDIAGLSYLEVSGTKEERAKQCSSGFEFYETDFAELAAMLANDFAYSPFRFDGGKRSKDNVIGGCKFIALDIDKSSITDEECHLLLEGINHHIARTSDKNNQFKFRVLIELDQIVDIEDVQWRYFIESVSNHLGLEVDILPKSQIFFSYSYREVLSELEGEPLATREHIVAASEKVSSKPKVEKLSTKQQQTLLADKMTTFEFAYECESGEGSRSLVRAGLYAIDLGASQKEVEKLIHSINNYWVSSMDQERLELTVLNYLRRKF